MKKSLLKDRILENVSTIALAFVLGAPALQAADPFTLNIQALNRFIPGPDYRISRTDLQTGITTDLLEFDSDPLDLGGSFMDEYNGKFYLKNADLLNPGFSVYDVASNSMSFLATDRVIGFGTHIVRPTGWHGSSTNQPGLASIRKESDGSIHIGENSLVTIEENGAQSLYATNAAGQPIDINITRGSNLLINGAPVGGVSRREIRNFDRRAVALSSALSALPTYSGDTPYSCGMGMGIRGDRSAMAIGCATDFSHFGFSKNMPSIIKNASFNAGSSFLMHDDADVTFKVGLSFKFGNPSSTTTVASRDHDLRYELNLAEQEKRSVKKKNKRLKELVEENKQLQARLDEIKARLADETKARLVAMAEIKMQLAALTEARVASN